MLKLDARQADALQAVRRQADIHRLKAALSASFPASRTSAGTEGTEGTEDADDRWRAHEREAADAGLHGAAGVAVYLACRLALGEAWLHEAGKPPLRTVLDARGMPQAARLFQLAHCVRPLLDAETASTFDLVLRRIAVPAEHFDAASLEPKPGRTTGSQAARPCDIDSLDLQRAIETPDNALRPYRLQAGHWTRPDTVPERLPQSWPLPSAGSRTLLPARLYLLADPAGAGAAHLRLRLAAEHCCDATRHPELSFIGPRGPARWQGNACRDLTLQLAAARGSHASDTNSDADAGADTDTDTDTQSGTEAPPAIAVETAALASVLDLRSCGLRTEGLGLARQRTEFFVYPTEQTLWTWRRPAGSPLYWPGGRTPDAPAATCRIERDGRLLDARSCVEGLRELDRQWADALVLLARRWQKNSAIEQGRMRALPTVLGGSAGLTWGWAGSPAGPVEAPTFRLAGELDLVACEPDLRLDGRLHLLGSLSDIAIRCPGRAELKLRFDAAPAPALLKTDFRLPFQLQIEPIAQVPDGVLLRHDGRVEGSLVGLCGLRPRRDAPGLQWFCHLAIEALVLHGTLQDPLCGQRDFRLPLLPAQQLLDWSMP